MDRAPMPFWDVADVVPVAAIVEIRQAEIQKKVATADHVRRKVAKVSLHPRLKGHLCRLLKARTSQKWSETMPLKLAVQRPSLSYHFDNPDMDSMQSFCLALMPLLIGTCTLAGAASYDKR